jgi:hypothetical protein
MNNDVTIIEDRQYRQLALTLEEAEDIDKQIVGGTKELQRLLLRMYYGDGFKLLGYPYWGNYLDSVSERAGVGRKALYRWHKASLLINDGGFDLGDFREGTVRPIIDTLSDRRGFSEDDRIDALDLAVEFSGGNIPAVTAPTAQTAAWYVAVSKTAPVNGQRIVERMRNGEVTPKDAHLINHIMLDKESEGMEYILAELSDSDLAKFLVNLRRNGGSTWTDIKETVELSGHIPTSDGQVPIGSATYDDIVGYLNEPQRQKRYEKAVEKTAAFKKAAQLAAKMLSEYWGIHNSVPKSLDGLETEKELYALLLDLGMIRYGATISDNRNE